MQSVSAPKPPCVPENKLKALRVERVELSTKVEELRKDANIEVARGDRSAESAHQRT